MKTRSIRYPALRLTQVLLLAGATLAVLAASSRAWASDPHAAPAEPPAAIGKQVRDALEGMPGIKKKLTLIVDSKSKPEAPAAAANAHGAAPAMPVATAESSSHGAVVAQPVNPQASRQYIRAKAAALTGHEPAAPAQADGAHASPGGDVHWSYDGSNGPQAWSELKPEFNACASGKRQSPINIEDSATLQGPAEPIVFNYSPSNGVVVNNGHTIQVDLSGDNSITIRGTNYKLVQFHFHHPSEERINYKGYAMVAHLVHKSAEGQLAVVAVLIEAGAPNPLINKVWTYLPLDTSDKVRMPASLVEMTELLPTDQRYYQFMGSLTTPPCSEGVLWLVLKQPMTVSREQLRLFSQLFPNNARPVQASNNRTVRNAL